MKNFYIIAGVLVLLLGMGYVLYTQTANAPTEVPVDTPTFTYTNATSENIRVDAPQPNAVVSNTFVVSGAAAGWYFEASFPIEVTDSNGTIIAQLPATAQGDWMTSEFVPFSATVTVTNGYTGPATIILKKDNPSGLPEYDASVSYPVVIQ